MLETSVAAVNSALQRARATLTEARAAAVVTREHAPASATVELELVRRLAAAWHAADIPAIVAILTEDALLSMPPLPDRYVGREAIGAFLSSTPAGGRLERFRLVPTCANAQPALAAYFRDGDSGPYLAHAILVLAIQGDAIASLVRFADESLFPRFGLPMAIESRETGYPVL
jgi:RNA polymerase sigma-70 factor (ECF subfamily)